MSPDTWTLFLYCSIFASFNDTFVHVTDLSGKETITRVTGELRLGLKTVKVPAKEGRY